MLQTIGLATAALSLVPPAAADREVPVGGIIWEDSDVSSFPNVVITENIEEDSNRWNRLVIPAGTAFRVIEEAPLKACRMIYQNTLWGGPIGSKYFVDCIVDKNGDGTVYEYIPYYRLKPLKIKSAIKFNRIYGEEAGNASTLKRRLIFKGVSGGLIRLTYSWFGGTQLVKISSSKSFPIKLKIRETIIEIVSFSKSSLVARVQASKPSEGKSFAPNP